MKRLTIIPLIFFYFLTAFGQNGLTGGNYFLLLKDKETISLNTYENNKINEIKTFTISENSLFTTDQKERVAIFDITKNHVTLHEIQTSKEIELSFPYNLSPKTMLLNDHNLFIGGANKDWNSIENLSEILVQYHIQSDKWHQLEIPFAISGSEKAIDDLLIINDSLLIAIDNIVIPKYILFYRLNTIGRVAFSYYDRFGSPDYVHEGRITSKYLGIRTTSSFNGANNILIYKGLDLKDMFFISSWQQEKSYHTFNDFLIIDNKIVIASEENGLGVLKIKNSYFWGKYRNKRVRASKISISYKKYRNENIINLTLIPNTTTIVLAIEDKQSKIRHEIINI